MEDLAGPLDEVFRDLRQKWREFQDEPPFTELLMGFVHAVDWTERWIQALVAVEIVTFLLALTTRKYFVVQSTIFAVAAVTIYMAERLNALGAQHWETFANQDYFDRRGVFVSVMVSGPLILTMLVILINYVVSCSIMLVHAKRQELKYKAQQRAREAQNGKESKKDS